MEQDAGNYICVGPSVVPDRKLRSGAMAGRNYNTQRDNKFYSKVHE